MKRTLVFITVTFLGIFATAFVVFALLSTTAKRDASTDTAPHAATPNTESHASQVPDSPKKDASGAYTCQSNPSYEGSTIETVQIDGDGVKKTIEIQC